MSTFNNEKKNYLNNNYSTILDKVKKTFFGTHCVGKLFRTV